MSEAAGAGAPVRAHGGEPARLLSLQYLRAAAALSVLLYHACWVAGREVPVLAHGVDLFFAISGFLMVAITDETSRPLPFLRDRILRIVPLYWLATAAFLAYLAVSPSQSLPDIQWLLASLFFLPLDRAGAAPLYLPVLPVGWTLNYEMFFYTLFAASLLLPRHAQLKALTLGFALLCAAGFLARPWLGAFAFWTSPIILEFLIGAWIGWQWRKPRADAALVLGLGGWALAQFLIPERPILASAAPIVAALIAERAKLVPRLRLPLMLGDASYSIYLWHGLGVVACGAAFNRLALPKAVLVPVAAVAGLAFGLLAYYLLERPLLRFIRRRRGATGAAVAPAP